jgi:hypothetical protein
MINVRDNSLAPFPAIGKRTNKMFVNAATPSKTVDGAYETFTGETNNLIGIVNPREIIERNYTQTPMIMVRSMIVVGVFIRGLSGLCSLLRPASTEHSFR